MSVFSDISQSQWVLETKYFFVIRDAYPVTEGHSLIISKRVVADYFQLNTQEKQDLAFAIEKIRDNLVENFGVKDFNIGMNCGKSAGQTVFHFHCHVIPRREGDVKDPRGGVRHSVVGKGYY
jgi:diadenosine tetraphosphate (Ap4A) HIT family hydrolase